MPVNPIQAAVKEILQDFDDIDTQFENLLEHEFSDDFDAALAAALVILKELGSLPPNTTVGDRKVQRIVDRAIAAFSKVWQTKAQKRLMPAIEDAVWRGVLQGEELQKRTNGDEQKTV